ncbi:MAG TPA: YggS family pyridoxal phosphate-dependent enzyme [Jiangellaceae bacterium]
MIDDEADIVAALAAVEARIAQACRAAGRDRSDVALLLATKTVTPRRIAAAVRAGARLIGENRVQELVDKADDLAGLPCERHFIGHLQTNKINLVLRHVTCIQSIDRIDLAERIQRRLDVTDGTLDVFLQINVSAEASKFGVPPGSAVSLAREVAALDRLRVKGLMTIGPASPDTDAVRAGYRSLRAARDHVAEAGLGGVDARELSMGMSGDLELAIAEGATMVRVGSAVFGRRPVPTR